MKSRRGQAVPGWLMGALAVLGAVVVIGAVTGINLGDLSATGTGDGPQVEVKDATLNLAASQLGSSSKISTTAYAILGDEDGTVVSQSLSSGQYTAWTDTFTNQMNDVTVLAFDSSNYPIESTVNFDGQTTVNKEIKTAAIATASDVSLEARETSGSTDNDDTVDIAAGGQATISSLRANVDIQDVYWNVGRIYVDTPADSNVTVELPNNQEVPVPDSAPSGVDEAYEAYNPAMGDNTFDEFAQYDSNRIVLNGDDTNDPAETITFYVDDVQANENADTGDIEYVVEDQSNNNLGLAEQSLSVTVN